MVANACRTEYTPAFETLSARNANRFTIRKENETDRSLRSRELGSVSLEDALGYLDLVARLLRRVRPTMVPAAR
jgi:hypothetical protein